LFEGTGGLNCGSSCGRVSNLGFRTNRLREEESTLSENVQQDQRGELESSEVRGHSLPMLSEAGRLDEPLR
jgi:hypothetical protein